MRALQALVIIMGVLLLAGSAVVAVAVMHRISSGATHRGHQASSSSLPGHVDVTLPAGSRVVETFGMGDRLAVRVSGPTGDEVLMIDPTSGAVIETISLAASPAPQP